VFEATAGKQPLCEAAIFGSKRDAADDVMTVRTDYPYQTLHIPLRRRRTDHGFCGSPMCPRTTSSGSNRTFGLLSIRKPRLPGPLHLAWPLICWFTNRIFAEDRWVVEREQEPMTGRTAIWNQEVFPVIRGVARAARALRQADGRHGRAGKAARYRLNASVVFPRDRWPSGRLHDDDRSRRLRFAQKTILTETANRHNSRNTGSASCE